jgi:response regulator RpfG family c-di-GMP phosphodiesterase
VSDLARRAVLIVDDDERILSALRRSLRREGYKLHTAESWRDALRLLEHESIDVVVSDHKMPGMMGDDLLEEVARRWPETVRFLLTGWPEAISTERLEAIGIRALIPKPWDDAELKSFLRGALEERAGAAISSPSGSTSA